MIDIITGLLAPWVTQIVVAGVGAAAVLLFGWKQKRKGRAEMIERNRQARENARTTRIEIDRDIADDSDEDLDKDLQGWSK